MACDNKALIRRITAGPANNPEALEVLAELLCTANWCEACDQVREDGTCHAMELGGALNEHCEAGALAWLRGIVEGEQNV